MSPPAHSGKLERHRLVLDQGQKRLLGPDALDVGLAADPSPDLVDLIHEYDAPCSPAEEILRRGVGTEVLPRSIE